MPRVERQVRDSGNDKSVTVTRVKLMAVGLTRSDLLQEAGRVRW